MTYPPGTRTRSKKTSFIPRLAYGGLTLGLGVIPVVVSAACGNTESDAVQFGPEPAGYAAFDATAPDVYPFPQVALGLTPDAALGDEPDVGVESSDDAGADADAASSDADAAVVD